MCEKIEVMVCTGTACYVMGGAQLITLADELPDDLKGVVKITGKTCMEYCKDVENGKVPFVKVNGTLINQATVPKVIEHIRIEVAHKKQEGETE